MIAAAPHEDLKKAIARLPPGVSRRYPKQLQTRIAGYLEEGVKKGKSLRYLSDALGIGMSTCRRLCPQSTVASPEGRWKRVVARDVCEDVAKSKDQVIVRGPGGVWVEGLDIAGAAALLKALS